MKRQRTKFDRLGYVLIASAWALCVLYTLAAGNAFQMGEMIAYLAVGSGAFMCLWMLLGWTLKRLKLIA